MNAGFKSFSVSTKLFVENKRSDIPLKGWKCFLSQDSMLLGMLNDQRLVAGESLIEVLKLLFVVCHLRGLIAPDALNGADRVAKTLESFEPVLTLLRPCG